MRIIELNKTRCSVKGTNEWCPFLYAKGSCYLNEMNKRHYWFSKVPKRLAACRREFPDGVIEIRGGEAMTKIIEVSGGINLDNAFWLC